MPIFQALALALPGVTHPAAFGGPFALSGALAAAAVNLFCVLSAASKLHSVLAVAASVVVQVSVQNMRAFGESIVSLKLLLNLFTFSGVSSAVLFPGG